MHGVRLNIKLGNKFIYLALTPEGRVYKGRWPDGRWVWFEMTDFPRGREG